MLVDLVHVSAADGLRLDGVMHPATKPLDPRSRGDALVCFHGTGSNFYSSSLFQTLTPRWLKNGLSVVWANTRGHDGVSMAIANQRRRRQGAAFESFRESPLDVRAWCDLFAARGHSRILLFGHSSGALKSIYTQATQPHSLVSGVIAVSPPRLSHAVFLQSSRKNEFLDTFRRAEMLVAAGEPNTLLEVTFPMPYLISAAGYLEKYGRSDDFDILKLLPRVHVPTLVSYGGLEVAKEVAFQGLPDAIAQLAHAASTITVQTIAGADHIYSGVIDQLENVVEPWLLSH